MARRWPIGVRFAAHLAILAIAAASPGKGEQAWAAAPCPSGGWADLMIGAQHIHPDKNFDDFNPGLGIECGLTPQWAVVAGYFRNSLRRPSFYGGAMYTPQILHWGWLRFGAMGGIITGYNYGRFGIGGSNNRTGPVLAPVAITQFGRFGVNFILIPPIPADDLPFTVGFQAKYRFK